MLLDALRLFVITGHIEDFVAHFYCPSVPDDELIIGGESSVIDIP